MPLWPFFIMELYYKIKGLYFSHEDVKQLKKKKGERKISL